MASSCASRQPDPHACSRTPAAGAQSGGVVTFEPVPVKQGPANPPASRAEPPPLRGVRSRVVNAKRADLSRGVRRAVVRDNCSRLTGNLRGWNGLAYNIGDRGGGRRLARGFFGHTRFATSSVASLDGTHPHRWSYPPRPTRVYSPAGVPRRAAVENYVTHNGDFEFYRVRGSYYDAEVVQRWLEAVLATPMPSTVDSGASARRHGGLLLPRRCASHYCCTAQLPLPASLTCSERRGLSR